LRLGLGVADEIHPIRKGKGKMLGPVVDDAKPQSLVVRDCADVTPLEAPPDFILLRKKRIGHRSLCSRPRVLASRRAVRQQVVAVG
jgi:hypothetical protein